MYRANEVLEDAVWTVTKHQLTSDADYYDGLLWMSATGAHNAGNCVILTSFEQNLDLARMRFCK